MTNAEARFNKIHIRKVYACLAVTCHLHFWQNDRDFLRATVVTRGWNGYRNKSQHRKSTLEKKILPPFQQGFEPATFQSRVRCSNHWAIPAPVYSYKYYNIYIFRERECIHTQWETGTERQTDRSRSCKFWKSKRTVQSTEQLLTLWIPVLDQSGRNPSDHSSLQGSNLA